jgi:RNA polymerase sigma factor (TIGR02999 family)
LQATALVHEAYLRLIDLKQATFQDRAHFFGLCAQLMRRVLVDWARSYRSLKRGGDLQFLGLDQAAASSGQIRCDLGALDDCLKRLELVDRRKSRVVELRFFGGLSVEETAEVLNISTDTVTRDWKMAKSWLRLELSKREVR